MVIAFGYLAPDATLRDIGRKPLDVVLVEIGPARG